MAPPRAASSPTRNCSSVAPQQPSTARRAVGAPSGVATPMTRISSGRQSPTAQSGSGSPHRSWEPTGWTVRPSPPLPTAPTVPKLAAILLHPTNQRIAASTGCGQAAHCTESHRRCGTCCHDRTAGEGYGQRTPEEHAPLAKAGHRSGRRLHRIIDNGTTDSASWGATAGFPTPAGPAGRGSGRGATAPEERMKSGHSRTVGQTVTGQSIFGHSYEAPPPTHTRPRPRGGPFHAQSGRWASPPGPVRRPRGMERRYPPAH